MPIRGVESTLPDYRYLVALERELQELRDMVERQADEIRELRGGGSF